jgi:hypothetical protein
VYEKEVLINGVVTPISMVPNFTSQFIVNFDTITTRPRKHQLDSQVYTYPFLKEQLDRNVSRVYTLAPRIMELDNGEYGPTYNLGLCTKDQVLQLYMEKKLIVYYNDVYEGCSSVELHPYPLKDGIVDAKLDSKIKHFFK